MYENLRFPMESRLSSRDHHLANNHMLVAHACPHPKRTFTVDNEGDSLRETSAADGTWVSAGAECPQWAANTEFHFIV